MNKVIIRKGEKKDLVQVLGLIKELAHYEKALDQVTITLEDLEQDGFGVHPFYWFIVAEHNQKIVGISFYFVRYSTWKGKFLFLEDFFVIFLSCVIFLLMEANSAVKCDKLKR